MSGSRCFHDIAGSAGGSSVCRKLIRSPMVDDSAYEAGRSLTAGACHGVQQAQKHLLQPSWQLTAAQARHQHSLHSPPPRPAL